MLLIIRSTFIFLTILVCGRVSMGQSLDSLSFTSGSNNLKLCSVRPTFLEFSVRSLPAINYYPVEHSGQEQAYDLNKLYSIKLNLPVVMSRKLDVIGQFRYKNEQLHLGNGPNAEDKEVHFDNVGLSVLFRYHLNDRYYIGGHFGGFFKADKLTFERYSSILDYNSSFLFGKNISRGTYGFGALFGNSLGRLRVYPMFLFDYQLDARWKLEMRLPREIQVRRLIKEDDFYLLAGAEVNGASYFLSEEIYKGRSDLEYRRAAIELKFGLEKQIYDFLWFGAEFGLTQPLYSALVQSGAPTRNKLFDFDHSVTPYGSFSVYLVPPKSLYNRRK